MKVNADQPLSTEAFADATFAPHGKVEIWPQGKVLRYRIVGPVNLETILAFAKVNGALLAQWQPAPPYATLSHWSGSLLTQPDALAAYAEIMKNARPFIARESANVWVLPADIEGRRLMLPLWKQMYADAGFPLTVFDNDAEAEQFVSACLSDTANR